MDFNKKRQENSRFSSLASENSNSFTKKRNNNSRKRYNRDGNKNHRYNDVNDITFKNNVNKQDNININDETDFPDMTALTAQTENNKNIKELSYLEKCNIKKEEDKDIIYTKLPKYWRGNIWIGPVLRKHSKPQGKYWDNYMETIKHNPPSSIIIPGKTLYSRDNKNWYNSFQETFTEQEWVLMEEQKHHENMVKMYNNFGDICDKWEARLEKESWEYYQETGELDGWALAKKEEKEYEEYCKQFETDNENEYIIESDDEYITD
tara:strand:- start:2513 stop:3304 length:792 start_codon:yes stop_codon:yes gene_type:complete